MKCINKSKLCTIYAFLFILLQTACVSKNVIGSYYYASAYVNNRIDIKRDSSFSFYANSSLSKSRTAGRWYQDGADLILNSYDTFFPARIIEEEVNELRNPGQMLFIFVDEYGEPILSDSVGVILRNKTYTTKQKNEVMLPDVQDCFVLFYNSVQLQFCKRSSNSNKFVITVYEHPDYFYLQRETYFVRKNRLMQKGSDEYYRKQ